MLCRKEQHNSCVNRSSKLIMCSGEICATPETNSMGAKKYEWRGFAKKLLGGLTVAQQVVWLIRCRITRVLLTQAFWIQRHTEEPKESIKHDIVTSGSWNTWCWHCQGERAQLSSLLYTENIYLLISWLSWKCCVTPRGTWHKMYAVSQEKKFVRANELSETFVEKLPLNELSYGEHGS